MQMLRSLVKTETTNIVTYMVAECFDDLRTLVFCFNINYADMSNDNAGNRRHRKLKVFRVQYHCAELIRLLREEATLLLNENHNQFWSLDCKHLCKSTTYAR